MNKPLYEILTDKGKNTCEISRYFRIQPKDDNLIAAPFPEYLDVSRLDNLMESLGTRVENNKPDQTFYQVRLVLKEPQDITVLMGLNITDQRNHDSLLPTHEYSALCQLSLICKYDDTNPFDDSRIILEKRFEDIEIEIKELYKQPVVMVRSDVIIEHDDGSTSTLGGTERKITPEGIIPLI
jgi:hypothetical protein